MNLLKRMQGSSGSIEQIASPLRDSHLNKYIPVARNDGTLVARNDVKFTNLPSLRARNEWSNLTMEKIASPL